MKTTNTTFTNFVEALWWTLCGMLMLIALFIYYLALGGDTTPLGDPYYEDQILAPERAFGPWALSLFGVAIVIILRICARWMHVHSTHKHRK